MYLKKLISMINITLVLLAATMLLGFFVITTQAGFTEVLPKDLENLAGSQNAEEIDSFPKIPDPEAPTVGYVDVYAEAIDVYITNWYAIYYGRQEFTLPSEISIDAVALYIEAWSVPYLDCGGDQINIRVNGAGNVLASGVCTDTPSTGWVYIDLDQEITLQTDTLYEVEFDVPTGTYTYIGVHLGTSDTAVGNTWLGNAFSGTVNPNMADIPFKLAKKVPTGNVTISPPSGDYVLTQGFDLTLIVEAPGLSVVGGSATLDDSDVTASLASCVIPGTLVSGGLTLRCSGLTGSFLGTGTHILDVTLDLSDDSSVSDTVTWEVKENTEP